MYKKKRNIVIAACMLAIVVMASAVSWDGSAMMGGYGDFPPSGYYAACNSFARNTAVEVLNLENGRSVTVIVTRSIESSGVFMMLSVEAATAIGLQSGRVARIRASEPKSAVELAPSKTSGSSYDPDFNPRLLAAQELKRLGYELQPSGAIEERAPAVASGSRPLPIPSPAETALVEPPAIQTPIVTAPLDDDSLALVPEDPLELEETPVPLASAKPKPVRTIVLPQLPAPSEPVARIVDTVASPVEELPLPDETPIRVSASMAPRLYEAPELLPDVSTRSLGSPEPTYIALVLSEPVIMDAPIMASADTTVLPDHDSAPQSAIAIARRVPAFMDEGIEAELAWPQLEADELPDVLLTHLTPPPMRVPATSLAEGEIRLSDRVQPVALVLETPAFDAAETLVSLEDADVIPEEKPGVMAQDPLMPIEPMAVPSDLASPAVKDEPMAKVEPATATETLEYIVAIEPAAPKPPLLEQATVPTTPLVKPLASVTPSTTPSSPVALGVLEKGRYYIQVGAYGTEAGAKDIASGLGKAFSALIEKSTIRGKDSWKVYVGPLSRDESGVALVRVRSLGYKDAFVKSGG